MKPASPLLLAGGVIVLVFAAALGTPADADLWGHITFGGDIVRAGTVQQPDQYSFTSDRPWVNHEWLAEVVFYGIYRNGGSPALIAFKTAIIAAVCGVVWWRSRRVGAGWGIGLSLIVLASIGTYWRMHSVRPQLFSVVFFAVLLIVMTEVDAGRKRPLLLVPPLMALWVNLHGGWIVGIGVLGLWVVLRVIDSRRSATERLVVAGVGLAALAATLINPYGAQMWTFLAETVRFGRADIQDWGTILTSPGLLGVPWALTLLAGALAVWRSSRSPRLDYVAIAGLFALASFQVSRLDAFFSLAVVILLTPEFAAAVERLAGTRPAEARELPAAHAAGGRPARGIILITLLAIAAVVVPAVKIMGPLASCITIGGDWAPDANAARFIQLNQLKGRMLTWFDWGEYAIWHFGPELQVSIDGRRETVYTERTIQAHRRFYAGDETASTFLRALNPDYIWVPKRLPVVPSLQATGWTTAFEGPASVVLARPGAGSFQQVAGPSTGMRCFPGP